MKVSVAELRAGIKGLIDVLSNEQIIILAAFLRTIEEKLIAQREKQHFDSLPPSTLN